jgi:type I restriction-modification system DNA methylase subunit
LDALWHLSLYREESGAPPRHVNYSALDVEELGSVYESLLELQPTFDEATSPVAFVLVPGLERKGTGSFYTPPELVEELLKTALLPVLEDRLREGRTQQDKEKRLLDMTICDPACGSGHFLLAAARRVAHELAKVRSGEDEPSPAQYRIALRDVISHCVYGVDKNPLAVELCKVALWLESYTEAKPLSFLDHRIQVGNSLVGLRNLAAMSEGIPEDATNLSLVMTRVSRRMPRRRTNEASA